MHLFVEHRSSPIGEILVVTDAEGVLRAVDFGDYEHRMERLLRRHYGTWHAHDLWCRSDACDALEAYFDGEIRAVDSLATATGGTPFQRTVWQALREVPAASTISYADLALAIGRPGAFRAVGLANGSNPIAIVVPCHRVIGRSGALTGYGGGIERKRWLIHHERQHGGVE